MRSVTLLLAIIALMLGCSRTDPVSMKQDDAQASPAIRADATRLATGFSPLAIGNRWRLHRDWAAKFTGDGEPWGFPMTGSDDYEFEQICTEVRGDVSYIVEKQTWWDDEGGGGSWYVRYRQDGSGLYQPGDLCLCEPPDCGGSSPDIATTGTRPRGELWQSIEPMIPNDDRAAAQASFEAFFARIDRVRSMVSPSANQMPFELTILEYPLYAGQSWILRNDPEWFVEATVEAFEMLRLPLGRLPVYRIRIDVPDEFDAEVYRWWGRCGLMQETMHSEGEIVGEDGEPLGKLIWDENQHVTEIDLVELRSCTIDVP